MQQLMSQLDLEGKKILVTGGAGFLGKQVVAQLEKAGALSENITDSSVSNLRLALARTLPSSS